ncbi:hypothetical protein C5167_030217 [Papaver somniferum]|uniref:two-component response regulator 24-like n=1 Tax=Papaver somniferum TaxID=3469 RepID=UPI000E703893|nr:two-component response regulator 24-like [Papaver somniferum]RZC86869.1 hypothetical protein C5167_030217 [Papaver somniferum]
MHPTTALVVDDSEFMRMFHSCHLRSLGFQTQEAKNGQEAVQLHEEGKKFDVILMDYEMPIMNGAQATSRIREMGIQSVILGVSGIDDETVRVNFVQSGLTEFFSKPLRRDMLIPYSRFA